MNSQTVRVRLKPEELEIIDEEYKTQKYQNRSSYIRHKLLSFKKESVSINDSKLNDIDLKLSKLEKALYDLKKNELNTINKGYKLFISFLNIFFKWLIKISLHQLNVKKLTQSEIDELQKEYSIPDRTEKVSYSEFKLFELRDRLK